MPPGAHFLKKDRKEETVMMFNLNNKSYKELTPNKYAEQLVDFTGHIHFNVNTNSKIDDIKILS